MINLKTLKKSNSGKYYYRNRWWTPNKPVKSTRQGKKFMVLVTKGNEGKIVHFGALGYSDFTKHKDEKRRQRYRKRHKEIYLKDGTPAYKNKFTPAYWSWNYLW